MKFNLQIDCDNAAFQPVHDDASEAERYTAASEGVRRVLRDLNDRMGRGPVVERSGFLLDLNGNRCGSWSLSDMDDETEEAEELDGMGNRLDGGAPGEPVAVCGNCNWSGPWDQCDPSRDLHERLGEPGDTFIVPVGDCPDCGAFCFPGKDA